MEWRSGGVGLTVLFTSSRGRQAGQRDVMETADSVAESLSVVYEWTGLSGLVQWNIVFYNCINIVLSQNNEWHGRKNIYINIMCFIGCYSGFIFNISLLLRIHNGSFSILHIT